jgi:hypothetical protein
MTGTPFVQAFHCLLVHTYRHGRKFGPRTCPLSLPTPANREGRGARRASQGCAGRKWASLDRDDAPQFLDQVRLVPLPRGSPLRYHPP